MTNSDSSPVSPLPSDPNTRAWWGMPELSEEELVSDLDPEAEREHLIALCPDCTIERADYEGQEKHLPTCPNCGSESAPVPAAEAQA